jgi:hypothetical protein
MNVQPDTIGCFLAGFFLVVVALVGGYEVYALFMLPGDASVTFYLTGWSRQIPALPLALGVILGHLFFPTRIPPVH